MFAYHLETSLLSWLEVLYGSFWHSSRKFVKTPRKRLGNRAAGTLRWLFSLKWIVPNLDTDSWSSSEPRAYYTSGAGRRLLLLTHRYWLIPVPTTNKITFSLVISGKLCTIFVYNPSQYARVKEALNSYEAILITVHCFPCSVNKTVLRITRSWGYFEDKPHRSHDNLS